jgi:hypothetical protein
MVKRRIPSPCRDSKPRSSRPQTSAVPLCYPDFGRPRCKKNILEWIIGKYGEEVWTGFMWLRIGTWNSL